MERLLPPLTLLLVVLLFPGFSRATYANYQGTKGPRELKGEYPGQETNKSHLLRHQVKRYLLPRTPPFQEPEPNFKVINCKRSEGRCQNFCNYMEMQIGYCSKNKDPCCLPQN
ncbi:sperm-associated antigen 11B-like [Phacochoerus africanus]|nr:sperm-associated antigen 11B-like [Phacochoerus africanus]